MLKSKRDCKTRKTGKKPKKKFELAMKVNKLKKAFGDI